MKRIDISETIKRVDFPEKIWEWLDLFGDVVATAQQEAIYQEQNFIADNPYKKFLLCAINKDLSTLNTIYILLRCELIHQASSHIRLLCESLITLQYVSMEPDLRADLFWGYADIETYKITSAILEWESGTANPIHVERLKAFKDSISGQYEKAKNHYSFMNRKKKRKPFSNWCNKTISKQAQECGRSFQRLYALVYRQLSAYIHGSAWSLRRQISYSRDHYQIDVIHNDVASIVRTAIVVWIEWAKFCVVNMNWRLEKSINDISYRLKEMDGRHFPPKTT